jgi:putative DNA primase/helicase
MDATKIAQAAPDSKRETLLPHQAQGNGSTAQRKIVKHSELLTSFLGAFSKIKLQPIIGLDPDGELKQKEIVFAVIYHILEKAKAHGWNLCINSGYVYIYNGAFWQPIEKDTLKTFLSDAAVRIGIKEHVAKHYEFSDKLLKQFLSVAHLPAPIPEPNRVLINTRECTFEFTPDGWTRRPFDQSDFLKYQLDFSFDENATCPLFDAFINRCVPDPECRAVLQEFVGYIFTNLNLEKMLVLIGDGGNGKSVFMRIVCALIGVPNVSNYSLGSFSHEYNRATLVNILVNYSSEKGFDLAPDIMKALISAEPLQAREIYQKPFTLFNRAKFVTNTNELPRETEHTEAYFRRFIIVPFNQRITDAEKDIDLAEKIIRNELPGVFNWLLGGLHRLLVNRRFTESETVRKELKSFKEQSDSLQLFLNEKRYAPLADGDAEAQKLLADLYRDYKTYCIEDGYKPLGKNRFSQRLEKRGFVKCRTTTGLNSGATAFLIATE